MSIIYQITFVKPVLPSECDTAVLVYVVYYLHQRYDCVFPVPPLHLLQDLFVNLIFNECEIQLQYIFIYLCGFVLLLYLIQSFYIPKNSVFSSVCSGRGEGDKNGGWANKQFLNLLLSFSRHRYQALDFLFITTGKNILFKK